MFGRSTASSRPSPRTAGCRRAVAVASATAAIFVAVSAATSGGRGTVGGWASIARAGEGERLFGLVDLSSQRASEPLRAAIEGWAAERGLKKLPDPGMRRALSGPEPARVAMARLVAAARDRQASGDCAGAADLASQAETVALAGLSVDDEREPLKGLYTILIVCEDQLGHADPARAAGVRLRTLVSLPPSGLPQPLWDRYAAPPGPPAPPLPSVELQVDSDPPNARVAINFHADGVTPRTLQVPPGTVYVEVEKDGYKKAFRRITVERAPARVVFPLADRRQDRTAQVESTVAALRGADPLTHPTTLARLAELARVDILVAIAANATGTVKMWWFDADRGDLIGDAPIESRFDAKTGRLTGKWTGKWSNAILNQND
jgi:hypothetical protein